MTEPDRSRLTVAAPCPECGQPVESYTHKPGYVLSADFYPTHGGMPLVPIPGTERRIRAVGADGPEWTLSPCGHQFYSLRFYAKDDVIFRITTDDVGSQSWS